MGAQVESPILKALAVSRWADASWTHRYGRSWIETALCRKPMGRGTALPSDPDALQSPVFCQHRVRSAKCSDMRQAIKSASYETSLVVAQEQLFVPLLGACPKLNIMTSSYCTRRDGTKTLSPLGVSLASAIDGAWLALCHKGSRKLCTVLSGRRNCCVSGQQTVLQADWAISFTVLWHWILDLREKNTHLWHIALRVTCQPCTVAPQCAKALTR